MVSHRFLVILTILALCVATSCQQSPSEKLDGIAVPAHYQVQVRFGLELAIIRRESLPDRCALDRNTKLVCGAPELRDQAPQCIARGAELGTFLLLGLGVIGEYLARIHEEVRARPRYLVQEKSARVAVEVPEQLVADRK